MALDGWKNTRANEDLASAHRLIMQAGEGPSDALMRGKASRAKLHDSLKKLRHAIELIEGVIQ